MARMEKHQTRFKTKPKGAQKIKISLYILVGLCFLVKTTKTVKMAKHQMKQQTSEMVKHRLNNNKVTCQR